MKEKNMKSQIEVFICCFGKECGKRGGTEIADEMKRWAKEELKGEIKVVRSGCLGQCEEACAIAVYPEKKFLLDVKIDDISEIKKGLVEALQNG